MKYRKFEDGIYRISDVYIEIKDEYPIRVKKVGGKWGIPYLHNSRSYRYVIGTDKSYWAISSAIRQGRLFILHADDMEHIPEEIEDFEITDYKGETHD